MHSVHPTPKFSVITVTYNAEKVLEDTIQSVIAQTYHHVEYIIVDGASKDGTLSIIDRYRPRIHTVVSEPDKGLYDAMNKGIRLATGDYLCFLNAGDSFHVKDDTDTEYAAKLAAQKGFDEVLLLGALGGKRVEHTLANLCTGLGLEQHGIRAALQDERSRITFVLPGESRRYPKEEFFYFSAFPMEGRAEGVYEKGSFYELEDAVLTAGYPLGVSNEYAEGSDCITISTRQGALVVVETIAD